MSYSLAAAAQASVMAEQRVLDLREIPENLRRDRDSWRDQARLALPTPQPAAPTPRQEWLRRAG
jgi:hypothetical protein